MSEFFLGAGTFLIAYYGPKVVKETLHLKITAAAPAPLFTAIGVCLIVAGLVI